MKALKVFFGSLDGNCLRSALYAWIFNLLFSLGALAGFYAFFTAAAGSADVSAIPQAFDEKGAFTFAVDIIHNYHGSLPLLFTMLGVLIACYLLFALFASGGIYLVLIEKDKATLTNLFFSSAQVFPSMLKMFLVNLVTWIAALVIPLVMLAWYFGSGFFNISEVLWPFFFFSLVAVSVILLLVAAAVYDFSRISRLAEDKNCFYSLKRGMRFVFSNKLDIFLVFLLYAFSVFILYLARGLLISLVEKPLFPVLLFVVFQILMLARYFFKIVLMQAEVKLSAANLGEE